MIKLSFGFGNAKLSKNIATFSLPAGHTCPFAMECLSKSDRFTGKITDGPDTKFRCFSASNEALATTVRNARWRNFELLTEAKTIQGMANLIHNSLPTGIQYIRLHVSGDFFNEAYFLAWLNVALNHPEMVFYAYTKSLAYWVKHRKSIPANFRLVASYGGKLNKLIRQHKLPYVKVVFSEKEAEKYGLELDHDDSLAIAAKKPFALLLHGTQPVNSLAAEAWKVIKRTVGGYSVAKRESKKSPLVELKILVA